MTLIRRVTEAVRGSSHTVVGWWHRRPREFKRELSECEALGRAVLVLAAVEAVVKLVCRTEVGEDEDKFGVVQAHVESIVNNMALLHKDAAAALQNGWTRPPFRLPWLAGNHEEPGNQIVQMLEWAMTLLTGRFGRRLEDEQLSKIVKSRWIGLEEGANNATHNISMTD
jgi:hypothetical protein